MRSCSWTSCRTPQLASSTRRRCGSNMRSGKGTRTKSDLKSKFERELELPRVEHGPWCPKVGIGNRRHCEGRGYDDPGGRRKRRTHCLSGLRLKRWRIPKVLGYASTEDR